MTTKEKEAPSKENGVKKTETNLNAVAAPAKTVSNEEAAAMLQGATRGDLDTGYLTFEKPGDKARVIFVGWKPIPALEKEKKAAGEMTQAVVFKTEKGKEQINADVAVRSYFEKQELGTAREITFKGMTKGPNGDYKTFEFHELIFKK